MIRSILLEWRATVRTCLILVFAVLSTAGGGCGRSSTGPQISGTVTFHDQPLSNGAIYFFPEKGQPVIAKLDETGNYSLTAQPGAYRVTVNKIEPPPPGWKEGNPLPPVKLILPAKYTEPATTELKATVAADQSEPINFSLK